MNALNMEASYRQASTDSVTGLGNRAYALTHLEKALLRLTRRGRRHTALVFLDLDRFKHVNDTHGHNAGDRLLARIAKKINSAVRVSDTTARYGGDEFLVICEDLSFPDDAHLLAKRLIGIIAGSHPLGDGIRIDIGVSVGIAVTSTYLPVTDFLHAADEAMYEAKHSGGNTYIIRHLDPEGHE